MRPTLRIVAYDSCCNASHPNNTNIAIPDWERARPGTSTNYPGPAGSSAPSASSDQPAEASAHETVHVDLAGLAPGHYTLRAAAEWQQHKPNGSCAVNYPPMHLARDGRDNSSWNRVATLDVSRDVLTSAGQP